MSIKNSVIKRKCVNILYRNEKEMIFEVIPNEQSMVNCKNKWIEWNGITERDNKKNKPIYKFT